MFPSFYVERRKGTKASYILARTEQGWQEMEAINKEKFEPFIDVK